MKDYLLAVSDFISEMNYYDNDHVLGIVVYGSYVTGYSNENSDVDVHIIMDDSDKEIHRAVSTIDGFKIEYFEKPISDIYLSIENDFVTNNNAYLAIIGLGNIIYDRNGEIE